MYGFKDEESSYLSYAIFPHVFVFDVETYIVMQNQKRDWKNFYTNIV